MPAIGPRCNDGFLACRPPGAGKSHELHRSREIPRLCTSAGLTWIGTTGDSIADRLVYEMANPRRYKARRDEMMEAINPPGSTFAGLSQAVVVRSGDLMFLSGHVGTDESGAIVDGDCE